MTPALAEFPKHPQPHVPQPQSVPQPHMQPPTVFVYEKAQWEYRVMSRDITAAGPVSEDELNALGREGWELVGLVPLANHVQLVLKRARA